MPVIEIEQTAVKVVGINNKRKIVHIENTGNQPVYFTKQNRESVHNVPTEENYDFILYPVSARGITSIAIESVSRINAVVLRGSSKKAPEGTVAYFETEYVNGGCKWPI